MLKGITWMKVNDMDENQPNKKKYFTNLFIFETKSM